MNSNYVAEIQSTSIPDDQLVSGDMYQSIYVYPESGYKLLVRDTCIRLHVSWCKRGLRLSCLKTVFLRQFFFLFLVLTLGLAANPVLLYILMLLFNSGHIRFWIVLCTFYLFCVLLFCIHSCVSLMACLRFANHYSACRSNLSVYLFVDLSLLAQKLSLIHIWRCRRSTLCRSRWSPYH